MEDGILLKRGSLWSDNEDQCKLLINVIKGIFCSLNVY